MQRLSGITYPEVLQFIPHDALRLELGGETRLVEAFLLEPGDLVRLEDGNTVPADGYVQHGRLLLNEAVLTGESRSIAKQVGQLVFSGTRVLSGTAIVRVRSEAAKSSLSKIMSMVESARSKKAPVQAYADRIAAVFVPIILVLGTITWTVWFSLSYSDPSLAEDAEESQFWFAFQFGLALIVISCPCSVGLAVPTAVMVATGMSASRGILIKGGDVIEKATKLTMVAFDKTGTLTSGSPQVRKILRDEVHPQFAEADTLYLAALSERNSEHPIGRAIVKNLEQRLGERTRSLASQFTLETSENINGEGIFAIVKQVADNSSIEVLCGNAKILLRYNIEWQSDEFHERAQAAEREGYTLVYVVLNRRVEMLVALEEAHICKPESERVVSTLRARGLKLAMLTGDNKATAQKLARHLQLDDALVFAEVNPSEKRLIVEGFQA